MTSITGRKQTFRLWAAAVWLLVWQGASMALAAAYPHGALLLASPVSAAARLLELLPFPYFWRTILFSMSRILGGFFLGCALAVPLAAAAAAWPVMAGLLAPAVAAVKAVPVASFVILALVWLDGRSLALFIPALMVFPPVYLNVLEGLKAADVGLLEMAEVFRVPLGRRVRGIYLPQVLPYFRSAAALGAGICWKSGIAAEVIGIPAGSIGERLYTAKIYLQTPDLFAWTAVIVGLSVLFERLFLLAVDTLAERAGRC